MRRTDTSGAVGGDPLADAEAPHPADVGADGGLDGCAHRVIAPAVAREADHRLRGEFGGPERAEAAVVHHVVEPIGAVHSCTRYTHTDHIE